VITSIEIENYRGIRKGVLSELPRIAVLTGPNGCGKSSVLEAIEIGSNVGGVSSQVVNRWASPSAHYRWLIYRGDHGPARARVAWSDGRYLQKQVAASQSGFGDGVVDGGQLEDNLRAAIFVEQRAGRPSQKLHQAFTECRRRGGDQLVSDLLRAVDPKTKGLEILTEGDTPVLHIASEDRTVPVALSGDGMEALVRIALELSQRKDGTFLIEEPETHQHSRALLRTARILVAAARNGAQIILSTHSMELLDDMLADLKDEELDWLAVYRLRLIQGDLRVLRMSGSEANRARTDIEDDLR
jgi:hypothetical protein